MHRKMIARISIAALAAMLLPTNAAAILGGELDGHQHPYVVHLVIYQTTREGLTGAVAGFQQGYCSGFAISPTLIVTAGHCTKSKQPGDINGDGFAEQRQVEAVGIFTAEDPAATPLYDQHDLDAPELRLGFDAIGEAIPHPYFVYEFYDHDFSVHLYDVGVVVLRPETPLNLERYAQLPETDAAEALRVPPACTHTGSAPCNAPWLIAVGYGTHDDPNGFEPTPARHAASVRYLGIESRLEQRYFDVRGGVEGHESVAAGSPCFGDSGGPLLLDGTDTVLGVISTGPNPCDGVTSLGQRIDLPDVLEWIQSHG